MSRVPKNALIDFRSFDYPGPIAFEFAKSDAPLRFIMGPFGSGKTSVSINEHLTRAIRMPFFKEVDEQGRHYRIYVGLVVRDSYRGLYKTSIPSWWEWFPPDWGDWSGGQDRPAKHIVEFEDGHGPVRLIMHFAAIGEQNIETFFKGFASCGIQFEEADGFFPEVVDYAVGRVGRFPRQTDLLDKTVGAWRGAWGSLNPTDFDHWIYKDFVEDIDEPMSEKEKTFLAIFNKDVGLNVKRFREFFKQPSGLSAQAENIQNLPKGYYEQMAAGAKPDFVRKNVHGDFGYSKSGQPVYANEFNDDIHFSKTKLEPVPGLPIDISFDAGGHPSATFRQKMPNGQRRYLREIVNEGGGVGPSRFSDQINHVLETDFAGFRIGDDNFGDPSAWFGGDEQASRREMSDVSFAQKVINLTGIRFRPAPSNEISMRTDAVREPLEQRIDNVIPAILFCKSMVYTRKGFNSKYCYKKDVKTGVIHDGLKPNKLPGFSDVQDCIQYQELGDQGLKSVQAKGARRAMDRRRDKDRLGARRVSAPPRSLRKGGFNVLR